jgi:hypothetical protein
MGIRETKRMPCHVCNGTKRNPKNRKKICPECNGNEFHSNICLICRREIDYPYGCLVEGDSFERWQKERCHCNDIPEGCI